MLTRESLLARAGRLKIEPVDTPEGPAFVRVMTAGEKDRFEELHAKAPHRDFRARVAVACLCDESGKLLCTDADVPALTSLPYQSLDAIVTAALRINKLTEEDAEALRKNSETGPDAGSSSDSRGI